MSGEIIVAPLGEVKAHGLSHLCAAITETFGRQSLIGGERLAPDYALNPRRAQHAASAFLQALYLGPTQHLLGVADLDLRVPELNFVFSLADFGGRRLAS